MVTYNKLLYIVCLSIDSWYLNTGRYTVPEIFINNQLIGGLEELENLDQLGQLDKLIQEAVDTDFPPVYRRPESKEFLKVPAWYCF